MKVAIISDIHENFHNLILTLQEVEKHDIDLMICLGDLMNTGVAKILTVQEYPVHMIWGNNDGEKVEIVTAANREESQLTYSVSTYDFMEIDERDVFITHYDDLAYPMAQSGKYDAVFYGHNHLVKKEKVDETWIVNPGELSAQKTGRATFALYDTVTNNVEIIELENSVTLKTDLTVKYFNENIEKLGFRSKDAFQLKPLNK